MPKLVPVSRVPRACLRDVLTVQKLLGTPE